MLYICILSNKFDLKQTIRVLHSKETDNNDSITKFCMKIVITGNTILRCAAIQFIRLNVVMSSDVMRNVVAPIYSTWVYKKSITRCSFRGLFRPPPSHNFIKQNCSPLTTRQNKLKYLSLQPSICRQGQEPTLEKEHLKGVSLGQALLQNIRLGWKDLRGTNTLAYHEPLLVTKEKRFITLKLHVNVIKNVFLSHRRKDQISQSVYAQQSLYLSILYLTVRPELTYRCGQFKVHHLALLAKLGWTDKEVRSRGRIFSHARPFCERAVSDLDVSRGRIFSCVRPFYERAVSDLDRSMHRSLWVQVAHSSFIEGSLTTKNTASGCSQLIHGRVSHN